MTVSRLRERPPGADLRPVAEVVSGKVWRAMTDSSRRLRQLGIGHVLIGGLAVGAHGWPRATRDVDFLVDDDAFIRSESGLVAFREGVPVEAHGVSVDTISIRDDEPHLRDAIRSPEISEGIPVAPLAALFYLKLASPRSRDRQDVIELVRAGADLEQVRRYLSANGSHLLGKFEETVREAARDDG